MNPGTVNNNERTGDRDLGFSEVMREPKNIRAVDNDVHPRCPKCKHAIARFEVKRMDTPEIGWVVAHTEYTRIDAKLLGVKAYFVRQSAAGWLEMVVTDVTEIGKFKSVGRMTREAFISWVERLDHVCK
jgi:hypothetical protein